MADISLRVNKADKDKPILNKHGSWQYIEVFIWNISFEHPDQPDTTLKKCLLYFSYIQPIFTSFLYIFACLHAFNINILTLSLSLAHCFSWFNPIVHLMDVCCVSICKVIFITFKKIQVQHIFKITLLLNIPLLLKPHILPHAQVHLTLWQTSLACALRCILQRNIFYFPVWLSRGAIRHMRWSFWCFKRCVVLVLSLHWSESV